MNRSLKIGRAVALVWQSGRAWTIANAAIVIVQGLLPLAAIYLLKLIVDGVADSLAAQDKSAALMHVLLLVAIAAVLGIAANACQSAAGLIREAQSQIVTDHVHSLLHVKSVEVDLEFYEDSQYHDALYLAQQEAPFRPSNIVSGLVQVVQNAISLLGIAGLLISLHWGLAGILFLAAIPAILVRVKYARKNFNWRRDATATERRAWYINWLLTGSEHAKEIRLFDLGSVFMDRFRRLRKQLRKERLSLATRRAVAELAAQVCSTLAIFGALAFVAQRTITGAITLGSLVMFYQAFQRGQGFLLEMFRGMTSLYEDNLFLTSFYDFLNLKKNVIEPAVPKAVPQPIRKGIVIDHVSFRYPRSNKKVLEDISFSIGPKEVVALVGENGAGKTTLVKLLCRLYDPTGGMISIDGIDLRDFGTDALRRQVGVILQDFARYNLTARENIWLGNTALPSDHARIIAASRQAGADEMILGLKHGYETILGMQFEEGQELSGGQWQAVALARAFVRESQIVILDEPTSSLDAKAEYELFKKFRSLIGGRAAVLISHRFSTVRMADRIIVLKDGRVVESGSHDELVSQAGMYATLFETQAQHYR